MPRKGAFVHVYMLIHNIWKLHVFSWWALSLATFFFVWNICFSDYYFLNFYVYLFPEVVCWDFRLHITYNACMVKTLHFIPCLESECYSFQLKLAVLVVSSGLVIFHSDWRVNLLDIVGWFCWNKVAGTEILGNFCITFYIWRQWSREISHWRYCSSRLTSYEFNFVEGIGF